MLFQVFCVNPAKSWKRSCQI